MSSNQKPNLAEAAQMLRGGAQQSPENMEAQKKIHELNRELNHMTQSLQMNLVQRL